MVMKAENNTSSFIGINPIFLRESICIIFRSNNLHCFCLDKSKCLWLGPLSALSDFTTLKTGLQDFFPPYIHFYTSHHFVLVIENCDLHFTVLQNPCK